MCPPPLPPWLPSDSVGPQVRLWFSLLPDRTFLSLPTSGNSPVLAGLRTRSQCPRGGCPLSFHPHPGHQETWGPLTQTESGATPTSLAPPPSWVSTRASQLLPPPCGPPVSSLTVAGTSPFSPKSGRDTCCPTPRPPSHPRGKPCPHRAIKALCDLTLGPPPGSSPDSHCSAAPASLGLGT